MRWSRPGACRRFQVASRGRPGDGWIGKGHDGCDNIAEQGWQPVVEILSASLCFPALLADSAVAGEHAAKRYEPGGPVLGHLADGLAEFGTADRVVPGQEVHVGEVPPAGAGGASRMSMIRLRTGLHGFVVSSGRYGLAA